MISLCKSAFAGAAACMLPAAEKPSGLLLLQVLQSDNGCHVCRGFVYNVCRWLQISTSTLEVFAKGHCILPAQKSNFAKHDYAHSEEMGCVYSVSLGAFDLL